MTKFLSWMAVIIWMYYIFYLSHQQATVSSELSTGITEHIQKTIENIVPTNEFEMESLHHIVRKNAHFYLYLILGLLVFNALRTNDIQRYSRAGRALLICVFYAVSDEFHQRFVEGRGPQVSDVLIDSMGAIIGIAMFWLIRWIVKRKK